MTPDTVLTADAEFEEPTHPRVVMFTVTDPTKVAGTVKYAVTGVDDEGDFRATRRFKEFHALSV